MQKLSRRSSVVPALACFSVSPGYGRFLLGRSAAENEPVTCPVDSKCVCSSSWDQFWDYFDQTRTNEVLKSQREELKAYLDERVKAERKEIEKNLAVTKFSDRNFDFLWEGNAFNGVGYGGHFFVFHKLFPESSASSDAFRVMASSGGAASAILVQPREVDLFLRLYQVWQLHYERGNVIEQGLKLLWTGIMQDTHLTRCIYAEALRRNSVFDRAKIPKNLVLLTRSGPAWQNVGYSGFLDREQAVIAGYASGNASAKDLVLAGTWIPNTKRNSSAMKGITPCAADGGGIGVFKEDGDTEDYLPRESRDKRRALVIYRTPNVSMLKPTAQSIPELWKAGIEDTIRALKSPKLHWNHDHGKSLKKGAVVIMLPEGGDQVVGSAKYTETLGEKPAHVYHAVLSKDERK